MLIVISPAKTLDYHSPLATRRHSRPALLERSKQLMAICRKLTPAQLSALMGISDKLASLNAARFQSWQADFTPDNARQAVLAFKGDVYTGLRAETFDEQDFDFAQTHLRILSGLYGILRPLDLMQPYRLEMSIKLANTLGADLYQFWGDTLTGKLHEALEEQKDDVLINLASEEYFKAVNGKKLAGRIIKPVFLDQKNGKYKVISFNAKKARGMMSRFIITRRLSRPEQLAEFNDGGYEYDAAQSGEREMIFKRPERQTLSDQTRDH